MPAPANPKPRNLERVRINQQRSRERKRAYIEELENKVKQLEQASHDANLSHPAGRVKECEVEDPCKSGCPYGKLLQLKHENRVRCELLRMLGFDAETQDHFVRAAPVQPESSLAIAPPSTDDEASPLPPEVDQQQGDYSQEVTFDFSKASEQLDAWTALQTTPTTIPDFGADFSALVGPMLSSLPTTPPSGPTLYSNCPDMPSQSIAKLGPTLCSNCPDMPPQSIAKFPSDSTTACSTAFSMVLSHNKRGYKFEALEARMRCGYLKGMAPGEECRILNKVLFEVLADIT